MSVWMYVCMFVVLRGRGIYQNVHQAELDDRWCYWFCYILDCFPNIYYLYMSIWPLSMPWCYKDFFLKMYFQYKWVPAYTSSYHVCLWSSEKGVRSTGTGVTGICKPPCGCWEQKPGLLQGQYVFLTLKASFQPNNNLISRIPLTELTIWFRFGLKVLSLWYMKMINIENVKEITLCIYNLDN